MLMLCLGIACIRVYFPIGFTRASIRDNVYCRVSRFLVGITLA